MEGVSPYLTESENRAIVSQIGTQFKTADFVFDVLDRKSAQGTRRHDTVSKTNAEFKFGIDRGQDLESWEKGIVLKDEIYYLEQFAMYPQRLPFWARYISFFLVPIFKNSGRILHLQINS